jgi:hypothetical protein
LSAISFVKPKNMLKQSPGELLPPILRSLKLREEQLSLTYELLPKREHPAKLVTRVPCLFRIDPLEIDPDLGFARFSSPSSGSVDLLGEARIEPT